MTEPLYVKHSAPHLPLKPKDVAGESDVHGFRAQVLGHNSSGQFVKTAGGIPTPKILIEQLWERPRTCIFFPPFEKQRAGG